MARGKKLSLDEQVEVAVNAARTMLENKGSVPNAKLGPAAVRARVTARLCSEGFEPTAKGLRLPLRVQGERVMALGEPVAVKDLAKRLSGAATSEAKDVANLLREEGKAHIVLRGKERFLVSKGDAVLSRGELDVAAKRLKEAAAKLKVTAAWLDSARKDKSGASVLEGDVEASIRTLVALLEPRAATGNSAAKEQGSQATLGEAPLHHALRGAILALADEDSHLSAVPAVSRRLSDRATPAAVIQALLSEHRAGKIELRPEGGIGRLSESDRALCPVGPGGTPLSWVRLLEE